MKTSVKLLLGLLLAFIMAMFGAAVSVKKQYDQLDKSDKYARWQKRPLAPFRVVQLTGPSAALVQIEPGNSPRILSDSLSQWRKTSYTQRVERDTLFLQIEPAEGWNFRPEDTDDEWHGPQLVVQVPALDAVSTQNAICQITGFRGRTLTLQQRGAGGRTAVENLTLDQLTAILSGKNQLTLYGINNRISTGTFAIRDSARLFQYTDFTQGMTLDASPMATLRLTGKAMQQAKQ